MVEANSSVLGSDRFHFHIDREENAVQVNLFYCNIPMDFVRQYELKIKLIKKRFNQQLVRMYTETLAVGSNLNYIITEHS